MKSLKFSLVIPVAPWRNADIMESIAKLDYDKKKFEVIIEKGTNASGNRNKGAEKAKGEIIIFLDDDAVLPPEYLKEIENFFHKYEKADIAGGPQLTPETDGFFAKMSGLALASGFGGLKLSSRYKKDKLNLDADECSITSANLACRKKVLKKIKFDTKLWPGEDPKFIDDCKKAGFKVAYSPDIYLYHKRRDSFGKLAKQIFSYGKVRPEKEKFSETLNKPFFLLPAILLVYLAALPFLMRIHWSFIFYLIVYLLVSVFVSLFIAIRAKTFTGFFVIIAILFTIHFSYGLGIIYGLFKSLLTVK